LEEEAMCDERHLKIIKLKDLQVKNGEQYTIKQITNIVKHYAELYSVVQLSAINHEKIRVSSSNNNREELLCALVDIDQSLSILPPVQQKIINMLKDGYEYPQICLELQLSSASLKYNIHRAFIYITDYLNSKQVPQTVKVRR